MLLVEAAGGLGVRDVAARQLSGRRRQAQICQPSGRPPLIQQQVCGLDVAVHIARRMDVRHSQGQLGAQAQHLGPGGAPASAVQLGGGIGVLQGQHSQVVCRCRGRKQG